MDSRYFSKKVAQWYEKNKRELPWRETKDPYHIWLSEIILQQTRVIQGLPYYLKFLKLFPKVQDLAKAPEQSVLRAWQGLGYYSRARNLHKCAKEVVESYNGLFPSRFDELRKLPGIGDYTAAAIASFSFGEVVPVVDGNVYRVLARIYGIDIPIKSTTSKKVFFELAEKLIPKDNPAIFNQSIMEFGALYCTPKKPRCTDCIFNSSCIANIENLQDFLPVKIKSKNPRKRYFYYFVMQKGNSLMMKKREQKDIWHGLYDFFLVEKEKPINPSKIIKGNSNLKNSINQKTKAIVTGVYKHVLSHQIIFSRFIILQTKNSSFNGSGMKYYSAKKISQLPKPVLINRFLEDHQLL